MRINCRLIVAVGLGVALWAGQASAQDAQPAIQIVIGTDGSVRVIDAKTGKILANVPAQGQAKPKVAQDEAIRKAVQYLQAQQDKAPQPGAAQPAGGTDAKLDLILKQLGDLRKDVDAIKKKLDGKQPDNIRIWFDRDLPMLPKDKKIEFERKDPKPVAPPIQVIPAPGSRKKIDPGLKKELDALLKEVTEGQKQIDDLLRKLEEKDRDPAKKKILIELPKTIDRNAQLERRIESLLREVDELRREIERAKKSPK